MIETEELCSINLSPLVTSPFAIQWSPDNQISIITDGGIQVFELKPSPMSPNATIKFARSFIYPSGSLPAYTFANKIDPLIWNLEREDIYSILMEETITPMLNGINNMVHKIVNTAWSPKNLISPSQCVLSILTTAGTVELLHKFFNEWYSICDFSSLRLKSLQDKIISNLNKCNKSNNKYAVITENMRQLQACAMTWSELFKIEQASFAYFSIAYCNGDILIWKIPRISNFMESLLPILIGKIDLNTAVKINVLCWITININEHLLIIGYFDGRICGIKLTCDNGLKIISIKEYVAPNRVAINYLHIVSQDESSVKILVTKGSFLLLLCINLTGTLTSMQHLQVQGFNISGIIPIAAQRFLITTQDCQFFIIDTELNNLAIINIENHLPQASVQSLGLAHSPNKVMFINITSPKTIYDHLVMREPSILHIFSLKGATCDPLSIINNSLNLVSVWDCMEVLRLKATKTEDPSTVLWPITEKLESLSLYNLQLSMWMTVMINVCTTKKPIPNMDHIQECKITPALPLIFLYSVCAYLDNSMKKSTLSKNQILAVSLLKKYIEIYLTNENEKENVAYRRAREMLNATASYHNQIEKCNLCDEVIDEFWNVKSCPRGHKLPRCTTTLLQTTLVDHYVCPICGQIFHPCLKELYEEPQCQFCDMPVLYNPYAFDVENSKLYGRNLSQRIVDIVESRELNSEETHESQRRNKWDTSHTYSIIVNDDDDESGRITEKWEKF
ncbi:uncharacterized protein [Anoplolepis gracilipes]|uniref:uncharacterized protein n=1 Tax=Anoplolepis gracilipes TaxID=354296 RepID=UPI003BA09844